jgi:hypothetical protein
MTPHLYREAADIARRAADHITQYGWTDDDERWDLAQEAAGTPRGECRATVIGALALAAYGDLSAPISARGGPADYARVRVLTLMTDNTGRVFRARSPEPFLREAAAKLDDTAQRLEDSRREVPKGPLY